MKFMKLSRGIAISLASMLQTRSHLGYYSGFVKPKRWAQEPIFELIQARHSVTDVYPMGTFGSARAVRTNEFAINIATIHESYMGQWVERITKTQSHGSTETY